MRPGHYRAAEPRATEPRPSAWRRIISTLAGLFSRRAAKPETRTAADHSREAARLWRLAYIWLGVGLAFQLVAVVLRIVAKVWP